MKPSTIFSGAVAAVFGSVLLYTYQRKKKAAKRAQQDTEAAKSTKILKDQLIIRSPTSPKNSVAIQNATDEFLREIPKTDIHVHLDGSLRLSTLIELAKEQGVKLPSYEESELRRTVFKDQYASLEEYLAGFAYTTMVMQNASACERVAYEFAQDNYNEGVRYFEVRFAPQLHCSVDPSDEFGINEVLRAVNVGLKRARDEANHQLHTEQEQGERLGEPPYEYGIIVSAMRMFFKGMSRYYDALYALHPDETDVNITSMASVVLVQAGARARDHGIPVVGVDIAGAERGFEASVHKDAFDLAHKMFMHKTVHAGEGFGPESIGQAVRNLHAERIGHGYHLFHTDQVEAKYKDDAEAYVNSLVQWVSDLRITLEVCLTSNLNTMPSLKLEEHPFGLMVENKLSVSISTDNRLVSNTTTMNELRLAIDHFGLSAKQLKDIVMAGFKRSFFPSPYTDRRAYVRQVMDYYDSIAEKYHVK